MKKAAAYARYSSDMQNELSIDSQLEAIKKFCKQKQLNISKEYIDKGISAFSTEKRLGFLKLLEDAALEKFDCVVVWSFDRFERSRLNARKFKELLWSYGIKVLSVTEPNIEGPESIIYESMSEAMAEYYVAKLARDSMRGLLSKARRGAYCGGTIPFGFKLVKIDGELYFRPEPNEAQVVQKVFEMRKQGCSYSEVARYVNQLGYKTRSGKLFTNSSIENMVQNPKYKGIFVFNKGDRKGPFNPFNDVIETRVPEMQIVSAKLWAEVQAAPGVKKKSRLKYLLRGIAYCAHCGYPLTGSSYGPKRNKNLGAYLCENCKRKHSKYRKIGKFKFERMITDHMVKKVTSENIDEMVAKCNHAIEKKSNVDIIGKIHNGINEKNKAIDNITRAIETGTYSESLMKRLVQLEKQRDDLHDKLSNLKMEQLRLKKIDKKTMENLLEYFKKSMENFEVRYNVMHEFVDNIVYNFDTRVAVISIFTEKDKILIP